MSAERRVATQCGTQVDARAEGWDRALVALAVRQHGVVTLEQLRSFGLSGSGVRSRVARGRLHPVHRGVYALGRPGLSVHGRWMAATLVCGPHALLSHRSAAALHELLGGDGTRTDVTVYRASRPSRPGIRIHCSATLTSDERASVRGVPCTSIARTLLDLAGVLDRRRLERACDQAEVLRLLDMTAMERVLARAAGRRGVRTLRAVLSAGEIGEQITHSELERRFLALCRHAGLPLPSVNARIPLGGEYVEVDFVWRHRRVIVETDGYRTHGTRQAFRRDRRRDQLFASEGWYHARFTWDEVVGEVAHVTRVVRNLLVRGSSASVKLRRDTGRNPTVGERGRQEGR